MASVLKGCLPGKECDCLGLAVEVIENTQSPELELLVPLMHLKPTHPGLNPSMAPDEETEEGPAVYLWVKIGSLAP